MNALSDAGAHPKGIATAGSTSRRLDVPCPFLARFFPGKSKRALKRVVILGFPLGETCIILHAMCVDAC